MRRLVALVSLITILILGCGAPSGPKSETRQVNPKRGKDTSAKEKGDAPAVGQAGEKGQKKQDKPQPRMIIYTARVELYVEDFDIAEKRMREILKEQEGYIARSELSGQPNQRRHGNWTLRVPVARFDAFMDDIIKIGEPRIRTQDSEDITDRYFDAREDLTTLEAREKALRQLYEHKIASTKLTDLIEVDRELTNVRSQINVRKGQLQRWDKETAFATIHLDLTDLKGYKPRESPPFGTTITRTFDGSITAMSELGKGIVLFFVAVGPWLVILSPIVLFAWLLWRRRRTAAHLPPPPIPSPPPTATA